MSESPKENPVAVLAEYTRGVIERLQQRIAALEQQLATSQAEVARLRAVLPPAAKLKLLAAWLDVHDDRRSTCTALRYWADKIDAALVTPGKGEE